MNDPGDIHLADFHDEVRRRVMVASSTRFTRETGRVLVVPELIASGPLPSFPWRIESLGKWFAVDRLTTISTDALLERIGVAPAAATARMQRAIRQIL